MKRPTILQLAILAALVLTINPAFAGRIVYVDDNAAGNNDGSSWADAFNYLQDALTAAWSGDEIRVAQGVYKPDQGAGITSGDRTATFQLKNGITLKGGYAGEGQPDPNARDIELYETILTGDLNGNDVAVNDPCDLQHEPTRAENSYHIVLSSAAGPNTVLEGFTIMDGKAVGSYPGNEGAGMYNEGGSPTIVNCTFYRNSAEGCGGGICDRNSSPTLTNCWFEFNAAGNQGGGMVSVGGSHSSEPRVCNPRLTNCIFRNNSAGYRGGGMLITLSNAMLVNCAFIANSAESTGGAFVNFHRSPTLVNCIILGNTARHCGGLISYSPGATLVNCILWSNHDSSGQEQSAQISHEYLHTKVAVNYSCIRGWTGTLGGTGNIGADPCFVSPGYWDANGVWIDGDYHLLPGSPCIDAGDPNYIAEPNGTDLDGKPRIIGGRIDMGAYESPIPAEASIVPRTINLASKGRWITCYIWLPEDYNVADIDPNTVFLQREIQAELFKVEEQQQVAIARFSRSDVQAILNAGEIELTITGQLNDGTVFEGTDIIKVIDKAGKK